MKIVNFIRRFKSSKRVSGDDLVDAKKWSLLSGPYCKIISEFLNRSQSASKTILSFLFGVFGGWLFYEVVLVELEFSPTISITFGVLISLLLGIGNAVSNQIRCILLLTIPTCFSRGGKNVLKALVLTYLISGPIENVIHNGAEVIRTFACSGYLANNLSKTRYELTYKPFREALSNLKVDTNPIDDSIELVKSVVDPIRNEIEGDGEIKKIREENEYEEKFFQEGNSISEEIEKKHKPVKNISKEAEAKNVEEHYFKKLEYRCQNVITKTEANCRNAFSNAYDSCYDNVGSVVGWLICSPMKLTVICNMFSVFGGEKACDPRDDISEGFGKGYLVLNHTEDLFRSQFTATRFEVKFKKPNMSTYYKSAKEAVHEMVYAINEKKNIFDIFCKYTKRILAINCLRIICMAQDYHDSYLKDVKFDNMYITRYFIHIDNRRKNIGKYNLLPLKQVEQAKVIYPHSITLTKYERNFLIKQIMRLFFEFCFGYSFFGIDWTLYKAMEMVKKRSLIEYTHIGHQNMELIVKGNGVIAQVLRILLKGFNFKQRVNLKLSNKTCLPNPRRLKKYYLYKIGALYTFIIVLTFVQNYTRRLFRVICKSYYRKREKRRVLFLYNDMLRKRYLFLKHIKAEVKQLAENYKADRTNNILFQLSHMFPSCLGCLKIIPSARNRCLICNQIEPLFKGYPTTCTTRKCRAVYCCNCWNEVGRHCFACEPIADDDDDETLMSRKSVHSEDDFSGIDRTF